MHNNLLYKNILMYPDTVILKFKRMHYCNYVLVAFGVLGSLSTKITPRAILSVNKNVLCFIYKKIVNSGNKETPAFSEISRINNLLYTLHLGYWTNLKIIGVGYKIQKIDYNTHNKTEVCQRYLSMSLGYSHEIICQIPVNIHAVIKKKIVKIWSNSYVALRNFSYKLFLIKKKLDNYKCKGLVPAGLVKKLKVASKTQHCLLNKFFWKIKRDKKREREELKFS